ncbi:MAG: DUF1292 domain-containing protein [Christensenellaceae bacterium]|nr:DUF1292 domain-containing protein [Christensenellaceae bacterium]
MSEEDVVILTDEDGNEVRFLHIMTFDFEDSFYVALTPEESVDGIEPGEVLLLEIVEDEDGDDCYVPIEDEAKLDRVWEEFARLYYEDDAEDDDEDDEDGGHIHSGCCQKETE